MTRFSRTCRVSLLASCCLLPFSVPVSAETRATFSEGGQALFSFDVPDFWTLRTGGVRELTGPGDELPRAVPQVLSLTPTVSPNLWIGFLSPPGIETLEQGRDYMRDIAPHLAFEPEPAPSRRTRVGGMDGLILSGTGRRDGKAIQYSIALVDLPGSRLAIAAAVIEAGAGPASFDAINAVIGSLRAGR